MPGSLLRPAPSRLRKFINILLPDGQAVFFECSTIENCARGFRVPQLYREPEPFAVETLAHIRAGLRSPSDGISSTAAGLPPLRLPRDEFVTVIGNDNTIQLGGLAAKLPNALYTYDLRPVDSPNPTQRHLAVVKSGTTIPISLPAPGLYELIFTDELNNPRIRMYVAALTSAQGSLIESFQHAHQLIVKFNEEYYGWPPHELGWAYVESFFSNAKSGAGGGNALPNATADANDKMPAGDVTAEPTFNPVPGVFKLNQSVALQCATPGGKIHFTVDGSQPLAVSSVYHAPINVKGTALTIKAFASADGKKDSPVVTGIFRIQP